MINKVLGAYVVADLLFVMSGALMIGFCLIVQNQMFDVPTTGDQAVRNLLYQMFPLTGKQIPALRSLLWLGSWSWWNGMRLEVGWGGTITDGGIWKAWKDVRGLQTHGNYDANTTLQPASSTPS